MSSKVGILYHKQNIKILMLMTFLALKLRIEIETDSVLQQEMLTNKENVVPVKN